MSQDGAYLYDPAAFWGDAYGDWSRLVPEDDWRRVALLDPRSKAGYKRGLRMSLAREIGTHSGEQWERLILLCGDRCCMCGTEEYNLERDHILPVYLGGNDSIFNIQPTCARCNSRKGPASRDHRPPLAQAWAAAEAGILAAAPGGVL